MLAVERVAHWKWPISSSNLNWFGLTFSYTIKKKWIKWESLERSIFLFNYTRLQVQILLVIKDFNYLNTLSLSFLKEWVRKTFSMFSFKCRYTNASSPHSFIHLNHEQKIYYFWFITKNKTFISLSLSFKNFLGNVQMCKRCKWWKRVCWNK